MKKVLVYGDSNVWGDNFLTGERIPDDKQWVKILQNKLKKEYIFFHCLHKVNISFYITHTTPENCVGLGGSFIYGYF